MSRAIPENIAKLTDTQLYALTQCSLLDSTFKDMLEAAMADRQLDTDAHQNRLDAKVQQPMPKLTHKDQLITWVMAICFPMVLVMAKLPILWTAPLFHIIIFFYFRGNPLRFKAYWQRGIISLLSWAIACLIYLYIHQVFGLK